jgi:4-hydroxy-tetrahydrodipicolinate synthase
VGRLSRVPGIIAVKSPSANREATVAHLGVLRDLVPADFSLGYSGDWNAVDALIAGADTWYSVLGGLFPNIGLKIVRAIQQGNAEEARRLDAELAPIWDLFKEFSSLRVVYALAERLDICRAEPPRPILPVADAAKRRVFETLERLPAEVTR